MTKIIEPIEGFFLKSNDDLIFDVKGLTHPSDRIIAFVRYVSKRYFENKDQNRDYQKLYALPDRYEFLTKNYPKYIFDDPKGRGLLQAVLRSDVSEIYNPIEKLQKILNTANSNLDSLEIDVKEIVEEIIGYSNIPIENIGISGSILVGLQTKKSDIDLVIYGMKQGRIIYESMLEIFNSSKNFVRYDRTELVRLWETRGQEKQIDFSLFSIMERNKHLQGIFKGRDFYIRLIPYPDEFNEHYNDVTIINYGDIEIKATIENSDHSIFTPCLYQLKNISIVEKDTDEDLLLERIFSLRGRYCDLAKKGASIHVKGKLEKISISKKMEFYQIVLGSSSSEFFKLADL
ncbi:MAG: hypothetical protein FK733_03450 [Asgard group archaeon]|nr:hypothetical protein [Asgard group archaeon]